MPEHQGILLWVCVAVGREGFLGVDTVFAANFLNKLQKNINY